MQTKFHYIVKAKLIRYSETKEITFEEIESKFENENPILARESAFSHYQSYIDILLQNKDKTYVSDRQAREDLNSFIDPGTKTKIKFLESEIELSDSFGNGIGVYLVIDQPIEDDNVGDEYLIHGIGNIDPQGLMDGLNHEYCYYNHSGYDTKDYKQTINFYEYDIEKAEPNEILETPFNWTGLDIREETINEQEKTNSSSLEIVIKNGETNQVEFKPALLYNFATEKAGISIKGIIAKTICAFLNSNGGFLFIGIADNGETKGLDFDFKLANGKNPKDFFRLEFDNMLSHFLSFSVKNHVEGEFYTRDEKDIFVITVQPNKRRPIFLKGQNGKEFYVRGEASTRQIIDMEELINYYIDRWTNY
jgi:Putative DNA-binding domain